MARRNFHRVNRGGPVLLEYVTCVGELAVTAAAGVAAPGRILGFRTRMRGSRYAVNMAGLRRQCIGGHRAV
jgi:hypothetical protein